MKSNFQIYPKLDLVLALYPLFSPFYPQPFYSFSCLIFPSEALKYFIIIIVVTIIIIIIIINADSFPPSLLRSSLMIFPHEKVPEKAVVVKFINKFLEKPRPRQEEYDLYEITPLQLQMNAVT